MTLEQAINSIKKTYHIKIIVNNKFYLFDCPRYKMDEHKDRLYILGYENEPIDCILNEKRLGYKVQKKIYISNDRLEERCLRFENLWYENHGKEKELC